MPYSIYLLLTRLERIEVALQACPNDPLLHFARHVSCLLNQTLDGQHTGSIIGIVNKITPVIRHLSPLSSNARLVPHKKYDHNSAQ
jgi:hypothetical protein